MEREIFRHLESYIVRYLLCYPEIQGWERQRHFRDLRNVLVSNCRSERILPTIADNILETLRNEKNKWPNNKQIQEVLKTVYSHWSKTLIAYILLKIECENTESQHRYELLRSLSENNPNSVLTLEHVMPRGWENAKDPETEETCWPITEKEYDKKARARDHLVHSIGNLTVLSKELNNEISQTEKFSKKKDVYEKYAKITNISLANDIIFDNLGHERDKWDVEQIVEREDKMFELFCKIWPSP